MGKEVSELIRSVFVAGVVVGVVAGYVVGRLHKAWLGWRYEVGKLRRDARGVRRGPRW